MSQKRSWESLRPWPVYAMAAVLPISLAALNISKFLMFAFTLLALTMAIARGKAPPQPLQPRTPVLVLSMLTALALSLFYTSAPIGEALHDLGKYGKLMLIPLVLVLVRSRREALLALGLYVTAETFVLATSYLLSMDVVLPWVLKPRILRSSVSTVYSSYLDQSVMTVGLAVLCWHLRGNFPGRHGAKVAIGLVLACAVNVLFLLPGRSGQVSLLVVFTLALAWKIPANRRAVALLAPLLLVAAAMALSPQFRQRTSAVVLESLAYSRGDATVTSSGVRLNYWHRSVQALLERPLTGFGVGSWNTEYRRLEGSALRPDAVHVRNPHQEYLLWGVQLGLGGIALFMMFMLALVRDASRFAADIRHATQSLVAMLATVCLFNASLFDALIGDYFCLLIGLLLVLGQRSAPSADTTVLASSA